VNFLPLKPLSCDLVDDVYSVIQLLPPQHGVDVVQEDDQLGLAVPVKNRARIFKLLKTKNRFQETTKFRQAV
jgi:hypothetical protein